MLDIMAAWVPLAHAAFLEYRMGAVQLSASAVKAVRRMIAGETVTQADSGLTAREWQELSATLELAGPAV
jgi:thymidylate synthase (FAD)